MKIELKEITVSELTEDFQDNAENGVVGYGGKLDIRPPYQREFVYKPKQRDSVIDTLINGFPLNVMYWAVREGEGYEIIDGQQRTISICQYVDKLFSFNNMFFHNLQKEEREKILNYPLMIYLCSGTDSEKLKWFETINIAGEKLYKQELLNAIYSGSWVTDAKKYFSRSNCSAYGIGSDYVKGILNRQDYLKTAIDWINNGKIEEYMGIHQDDQDASELWEYFRSVISWVKSTFVKRKDIMQGVDWGTLYNQYNSHNLDKNKIEMEVAKLILDEEVTNHSGIYPYVLTRDERHLQIRIFTKHMKQKVYEKQGGKCKMCKKDFDITEMEADHRKPWCEGGKTNEENCQMLCRDDNRKKSNK